MPMFSLLMAMSVPEGWGTLQASIPSCLETQAHLQPEQRGSEQDTQSPIEDPQGPMEDLQGARAGSPQCNILCPPGAGAGRLDLAAQHNSACGCIQPGFSGRVWSCSVVVLPVTS